MSEKTVSITVSSNNITVTVTDADNYPAASATVTAKLAPDGPTTLADGPQNIPGGAQFQFSDLKPDGPYLVSVDCGQKLFARVVQVTASVTTDNNAILIFFTETNPPTRPAKVPRAIGTLLPTARELDEARARQASTKTEAEGKEK